MLTQEDLQKIGALLRPGFDRLDRKIETEVSRLDQRIGTLTQTVETLDKKVETLDQKIETVLALTKKAHAEIMEHLVKSNEITGQEVKALEKRVDRLEEHTGLAKPS